MDVDVELIIIVICITVLGVVYFITIRQDSSVLLSLSSILGGIAGYEYGRRRRVKH